jgi:hypothetical protein
MAPLAILVGIGRTAVGTGAVVAVVATATGIATALEVRLDGDGDSFASLHPTVPMINKKTDG